jgi:dihydropteroate synthase
VAAGAVIVTDVSGGLADPEMLPQVAATPAAVVLSHWRGPSDVMDSLAKYTDVVAEVRAELAARIEAARAAGIDPARIAIDPGLGFSKRGPHNWALLARLDALAGLGHAVLVGASRKRFLAEALDRDAPAGPDRDAATQAITALVAARGLWAVRVHEVAANRDATRIAAFWRAAPT